MSLLNPFERSKEGGSHSGIYLLARRLNGRKQPPSLSVMVIRTLEPTFRVLPKAGWDSIYKILKITHRASTIFQR